jgi:hypothetical protein
MFFGGAFGIGAKNLYNVIGHFDRGPSSNKPIYCEKE